MLSLIVRSLARLAIPGQISFVVEAAKQATFALAPVLRRPSPLAPPCSLSLLRVRSVSDLSAYAARAAPPKRRSQLT